MRQVQILGALFLFGACNGGTASPETQDDGQGGAGVQGTPPQSSADIWYQRLSAGNDVSSLGFSGQDAADAFAGQYTSTLSYEDGGQTQLSIDVVPTGAPLEAFDDGTVYAIQTVPGRMGTISRGVKEGSAVVLAVDVVVQSADGRLDETFSATLRAFDLEFARFERVVAMSDAASGVHQLEGTFDYEPSDFPGGTIAMYVDLYREAGSAATSGWLGGVEDADGVQVWKRPLNELAAWGECRFAQPDAGAPACSDAGVQ